MFELSFADSVFGVHTLQNEMFRKSIKVRWMRVVLYTQSGAQHKWITSVEIV